MARLGAQPALLKLAQHRHDPLARGHTALPALAAALAAPAPAATALAATALAAAALAAAVAAALAGNGVYLSTCVVTIIDTLWLCAYLISIFCANDNVHGQRREHDTTTMTGIERLWGIWERSGFWLWPLGAAAAPARGRGPRARRGGRCTD